MMKNILVCFLCLTVYISDSSMHRLELFEGLNREITCVNSWHAAVCARFKPRVQANL